MTSLRWNWFLNPMFAIFAVLVALATSAMAGCMGTPQAVTATPQAASGSSSRGGADEPRGIGLERDRLGFEHSLLVRRSKDGVPHELQDGATVTTGDRIRVSIQTSEDAYLYLAFCAHKALAVYPSPSGIRTRARDLMAVPPAGAELVFDGDPGPEVLYVILSRTAISIADPKLTEALAAQRPSNMPVDCGTSLDAELAKPSSNAAPAKARAPSSMSVGREAMVAKPPLPPPHRPHGPVPSRAESTPSASSGSSVTGRNSAPPDAAPPGDPPPEPGTERTTERNSGALVWYRDDGTTGPADAVAADADGIAVVRHTFTHVAQTSPP